MDKISKRLRRKRGIRKRIYGTSVRPRISVFKSNRHIYVQAIDDDSGSTIGSSSDFDAGVKRNIDGAMTIGQKLAEKLLKKNVKDGVFDRNGFIYCGLIKALCDGIRKGGLKV